MAPKTQTGLVDARKIAAGLFTPRPEIYWPDFLLSAGAGWAAFAWAVSSPIFGMGALAVILAVLLLYRAALFIHELTHLKSGALPGFNWAWNVLLGMPMLVPSYLYEGVHLDHHRRTLYGTRGDPEYRPLASGPRWQIVTFVIEVLLGPALLFVRHLLLAPVGWLYPPFHRFLERCVSGLVINPHYRRERISEADRTRMKLQELGAFLIWGGVFALVDSGSLPARVFFIWYLVASGVLVVNQVRTLGAHRYANDGEQMSVVEQLEDSVNVPGNWLTELWAPVGLRYHGLHHYLPDLPYHSLGTAHRRLMQELPADAPYRKSVDRSLISALKKLWSAAGTPPTSTAT